MKNKEKATEICEKYGVSIVFPTNEECISYSSAMEMAEWKDSQLRDILLSYTKWLDKRGFFAEDLQCDFEHQIDTFLEMNDTEDKGE